MEDAMTVKTVGVRELKTHLSRYLREARGGATIVVTDRNEPIALLMSIAQVDDADLAKRMVALREQGMLSWSGGMTPPRLLPARPKVTLRGDRLASDLLLEDRR